MAPVFDRSPPGLNGLILAPFEPAAIVGESTSVTARACSAQLYRTCRVKVASVAEKKGSSSHQHRLLYRVCQRRASVHAAVEFDPIKY